MTIEELLDKVPESIRPVAREYGPALIQMSYDELWDWITLLVQGKTDEAYQVVLLRLDNDDLSAEWAKVNAEWAAENDENAARIRLGQRAVLALIQALLAVALALVGL